MKFRRTLLFSLTALTVGLTLTGVFSAKNKVALVRGYANGDGATYYNDIDVSLSGNNLLSALQNLNKTKRQSLVGYDNMPYKFQLTDPGTSSGQVTSFYSGTSAKYSGNMNREHTWPASKTVGGRGNDPLEDDIHMTRPTLTSDNSSRGNSFYTYSTGNGWDPGSLGVQSYRGDSARIILYCVVADSRLSLVDRDYDASTNHTMGKLSTLLEWNLKYPVLSREQTRNEEAEKLQGNRNPFIDHPEYACKIWGNYNETTKSICGYDKPSSFKLDSEIRTMEVGKKFRFSYTIEPIELEEDAYVEWESSDPSVASITSGGLIETIKPGVTTITAKIDMYDLTATCLLTVVEAKDNDSSSSGCGGNIYTTSIILSTISLVGVSLLLLKKKGKKYEK